MKATRMILLALLMAAAGCNRSTPAGGPKEAAPSQPTLREAAPDEGVVRIEPEMLRDLNLTTAEVESRPAGEGSMLLGELRVNENAYAEVGAPISSRVVALHAGIGQNVRAGQPLATLQSTELGRARSQIITANARLELAQQTLERKRRLRTERIVSERDVQEAEAAAREADAELRAARAALRALGASSDEASTDSSKYELRTPVSGTVIARNAVKGQMADAEEVLFKVGDLSVLWLTAQAFERDAMRIRPGSEVRIVFPALPGSSFTGKVDLVGREVNPESRTVAVRIVIANTDGRLRPGMSATTWVTPRDETTMSIMVPTAALQRLEEDWVVFIPQPDEGVFQVRTVGRGRDLGGEIEVISGLQPGERVVVDGAFLLKAQAEKAHGEGEHEH